MSADKDVSKLAELLVGIASLGRQDVIARRGIQGGYYPERKTFTIENAKDQLDGRAAFGVYLVEGESTRLGVIDFDDHDQTFEFTKIVELASQVCLQLIMTGMKPIMFRSGGGRGVHIWLLFENRQSARAVRAMLRMAIGRCQLREGTKGVADGQAEVFPKQDRVSDDALGSLIALPFGRQSGWINPADLTVHSRPEWTREWASALSPDVPPTTEMAAPLTPSLAPPLPNDLDEVAKALKLLPADDYEEWIRVAIAMKNAFGDEGFTTWHAWSQTAPAKYKSEADCRKVWDGLRPRGKLGIASIFFMAQQRGWNGPESSPIRKMNQRFGILTHGSKTLIIVKNGDRRPGDDVSLLGVGPFLDRLAPERIAMPGSDGGSQPIAPYWMKHRDAAHYYRLDFDPSLPPGHNGTTWNVWEGFAYEPLPGSWGCLRQHLLENLCNGNGELFAWLMNWLALGVQKPADPIGTALVLRGAPGTGKGMFAGCYGALWGGHYIAVTQASHVSGRFNAHLFARRLVFIDEGTFGGNRKEAGVLKTMVTEPYTILERKGVDPIRVRNRSIYIVASNEDSIVPADVGDRRWMVLDVSDGRKEDRAYFGTIMAEMNNGGYEAMMYDLLNHDIAKGPDPRRTIKTDALVDQILRAQPAYVQYLHHLLDQRRLPQNPIHGECCTTIKAMHEELRRLHPSERHLSLNALGRHVKQIVPTVLTDQNGRFLVRRLADGQAEYETSTRYRFPAVNEGRQAFERYIGQPVPWSDDGTDWLGDPTFSPASEVI